MLYRFVPFSDCFPRHIRAVLRWRFASDGVPDDRGERWASGNLLDVTGGREFVMATHWRPETRMPSISIQSHQPHFSQELGEEAKGGERWAAMKTLRPSGGGPDQRAAPSRHQSRRPIRSVPSTTKEPWGPSSPHHSPSIHSIPSTSAACGGSGKNLTRQSKGAPRHR